MPGLLQPKPKPKPTIRYRRVKPADKFKIYNLRGYDPLTGSQTDKQYRSLPKLEQWKSYYRRKGIKTRQI